VILFGFYLIYDIQLLAGGGAYELNSDDYILGALLLYIDIITIFLHILKIIGSKR
jgi:FtsH-binding integral membrane protein